MLPTCESAPVPMGAAVFGDEVLHEVDGQHRFGGSCQGAREATDAGSQLDDSLASNVSKHSEHLQAKWAATVETANSARLVQGLSAFNHQLVAVLFEAQFKVQGTAVAGCKSVAASSKTGADLATHSKAACSCQPGSRRCELAKRYAIAVQTGSLPRASPPGRSSRPRRR